MDRVEGGKVVAVDPSVVTAVDARRLAEKIKKKGGEYKAVDENLVDAVWKDRPSRPSEKVIVQPMEFAGKSFEDKISDLRKELEKRKSLGFVVSMLDEIAWLFNIRGSEYVHGNLTVADNSNLSQHPLQPRPLLLRCHHADRCHTLRRRQQATARRQRPSRRQSRDSSLRGHLRRCCSSKQGITGS